MHAADGSRAIAVPLASHTEAGTLFSAAAASATASWASRSRRLAVEARHAGRPRGRARALRPAGRRRRSRSSPSISSVTWRSSSSHARAASGAPSAPASATASTGAPRTAAAISDGARRRGQLALDALRPGAGRHDRPARCATNPSPSSHAPASAERRRPAAPPSSSRSPRPSAGSSVERPRGHGAIERHPAPRSGQSGDPCERLERRRLAQQQAQLVAHPRRRDGRQRATGDASAASAAVSGLDREAQPRRVAHEPQQPRRVVEERALVQDPQHAARRDPHSACGAATARPSSRHAIALTVKSRRSRSSASVAGCTSGSAPGLRVASRPAPSRGRRRARRGRPSPCRSGRARSASRRAPRPAAAPPRPRRPR